MKTQKERIEFALNKFKDKDFSKLPKQHQNHIKVWEKKLDFLKKHPEFDGKVYDFEKRDIFCCSSRNKIIMVEIDKIENGN